MRLLDDDWQTLKADMRTLLIETARQQRTVTYSALAAQLSLHHRAPAFHHLIRAVDADETAAGRPSLAALVVRKDTGIPGAGFYAGAPMPPGGAAFDPERYWRAEFEQVCAYWGEG
ncbi:MAG: hypothetical protein H7Y11_14240 [Armatimonadetes bacterium]|nr:hypothetical protein [Anaerolineae bacterium]